MVLIALLVPASSADAYIAPRAGLLPNTYFWDVSSSQWLYVTPEKHVVTPSAAQLDAFLTRLSQVETAPSTSEWLMNANGATPNPPNCGSGCQTLTDTQRAANTYQSSAGKELQTEAVELAERRALLPAPATTLARVAPTIFLAAGALDIGIKIGTNFNNKVLHWGTVASEPTENFHHPYPWMEFLRPGVAQAFILLYKDPNWQMFGTNDLDGLGIYRYEKSQSNASIYNPWDIDCTAGSGGITGPSGSSGIPWVERPGYGMPLCGTAQPASAWYVGVERVPILRPPNPFAGESLAGTAAAPADVPQSDVEGGIQWEFQNHPERYPVLMNWLNAKSPAATEPPDAPPADPTHDVRYVPDCTTLTWTECQSALTDAGLTGDRVIVSNDDAVLTKPAGAVLALDPGEGSALDVTQGASTVVTVRTNPDALPVVVPDIQSNQTPDAYAAALAQVGLQPSFFTLAETDPDTGDGDVAEAAPEPGSRVNPGTTVNVAVNPASTQVSTEDPRCDVNNGGGNMGDPGNPPSDGTGYPLYQLVQASPYLTPSDPTGSSPPQTQIPLRWGTAGWGWRHILQKHPYTAADEEQTMTALATDGNPTPGGFISTNQWDFHLLFTMGDGNGGNITCVRTVRVEYFEDPTAAKAGLHGIRGVQNSYAGLYIGGLAGH